jgi:ABC-type transporter lipoprotein component MlaA
VLLLLGATSACFAADSTGATNQAVAMESGQMPYFDAVNDPLEGFNRCSWAVNEWLFRGVLYPLSWGYNTVTPRPVRSKLSNAGHNLTYPVRLVNSALQGKWKGAWEETKRFGVNSTVGIGGLFDPATKWKIGRSDEDFGLTMGHWGAGPWFYLMLPILGPSNGRDALGQLVDWPLDIAFWITQAYPHELWPETIRPGFTFNDLSDVAPELKRQLDSLVDPYQALRAVYSLNRDRLISDYQPPTTGDFHPDPTVGAVLFKPLTEDFANRATTRHVVDPCTGKKLAYTCWIQNRRSPLVCYIPGLGSYRLDRSTLAFADLLFRNGYSVVAISNPFQQEFMERASTMAVPGYSPEDADNLAVALRAILTDLRQWRGDLLTSTSLTGVSHGGYFTLMLAAREAEGKLVGLSFDRYVAVNPPVSLVRALAELDDMFNSPLSWPAAERRQRMTIAIYKALYFAQNSLDVSGSIPLTEDESRFLIGLVFRYTLMSVIVDSQRRENLGVLKADPNKFVRQEAYREIRQISYTEYLNRFVVPYLILTGRGTNREALLAETDLTQSTSSLSHNPKIRVQICEDDFLLKPADVAWFHSTFGDNLKAYKTGGHLGNLHEPAVQESMVRLFPGIALMGAATH